jgi:hypothetical protein
MGTAAASAAADAAAAEVAGLALNTLAPESGAEAGAFVAISALMSAEALRGCEPSSRRSDAAMEGEAPTSHGSAAMLPYCCAAGTSRLLRSGLARDTLLSRKAFEL